MTEAPKRAAQGHCKLSDYSAIELCIDSYIVKCVCVSCETRSSAWNRRNVRHYQELNCPGMRIQFSPPLYRSRPLRGTRNLCNTRIYAMRCFFPESIKFPCCPKNSTPPGYQIFLQYAHDAMPSLPSRCQVDCQLSLLLLPERFSGR